MNIKYLSIGLAVIIVGICALWYCYEQYKYHRDNKIFDEDDDYITGYIWEGNTLNETDIESQAPFPTKEHSDTTLL